MTPEQQSEFAERRNKFLGRYKELITNLEVDFISYPEYIPTDKGTYEVRINTVVADQKYRAKPSPFVDQ